LLNIRIGGSKKKNSKLTADLRLPAIHSCAGGRPRATEQCFVTHPNRLLQISHLTIGAQHGDDGVMVIAFF